MEPTIINVQAITDSINSANNQIAAQEAALGEIDSTVNSMSGVWEAEDQRVYAEQFQATKKKIEDFNQAVMESLKTMQQFVNDCVAVDDKTGQDLRNVTW